MTRAELIEEVFKVVELPERQAVVIVEEILDSMVRALRRGDKVEIRGFGSFHMRHRAARLGRNPEEAPAVLPILNGGRYAPRRWPVQ